jgi:predicted GNAT family N-acyltransferase
MKLFTIIDQLNSAQIDQLHELFKQMWWTKTQERTKEDISIMLRNCMSFGVIESDTQNLVGYARVLTDGIKYAFIFDVMAVDYHRGKGLGKMLMDAIIAHPRLKNIKNFELTCAPDMVAFYEKFGFSENYGGEVRPMRYNRSNS